MGEKGVKVIKFTVPGQPQGKARARTFYNGNMGRMQSVTPEKTVLYENLIKSCYEKKAEEDMIEGFFNGEPVRMSIEAVFDIPKSKSKKVKAQMYTGAILPTKKPDADNIAKVVCDALNGVAYKDDTQVCSLTVIKRYTTAEENGPGVEISISKLM